MQCQLGLTRTFESRPRFALTCLLLSFLLVSQSGCASLYSNLLKKPSYLPGGSIGYRGPRIYSGTRIDAEMIAEIDSAVIGLIDIVPSAAVDTLFLPYTLIASSQDEEDRLGFIENQIELMKSEDVQLRYQGIVSFKWIDEPGERALAKLKSLSRNDGDEHNRRLALEILSHYEADLEPDS